MSKLLMVFLILGVAGCSNKAIYDNMRINQRNQCLKEPPPAYFECIERANKSYEEYERERKELLENSNHKWQGEIKDGFDYKYERRHANRIKMQQSRQRVLLVEH